MSVPTDRSRSVSSNETLFSRLPLPWVLGILAGLSLGALAGRLLPSDDQVGITAGLSEPFSLDVGSNGPLDRPMLSQHDFPEYQTAHIADAKHLASPDPEDEIYSPANDRSLGEHGILRTADTKLFDPARIPRTIQSPSWASPIPRGLKAVSEISNPQLESMLHQELPFADASERQVWQDVLDGMPLDDAREIVRMRTRLSTRPLIGPGTMASVPKLSQSKAQTPPSIPPFEGSLHAFDAAEQVIRHNIANAGALGFLPGIPLMVEAVDRPGTRCLGEMVLADQWTTLATAREADIVPLGQTFIGVVSLKQLDTENLHTEQFTANLQPEEDQASADPSETTSNTDSSIALTKFGRMTASEGYLAVDFADGPRRVLPEVLIEDGESVTDAISRVQFWSVEDPGHLARAGGGRFRSTNRSGLPAISDGVPERNSLAIGDVDVDAAIRQLELLQARRVLLQHAGSLKTR